MKILCLIDNLGSGGAQRQMTNLALLFQERAIEVKFLTYGRADFFKSTLTEANIVVDTINEKNILDRIFKVRRYLRNGNQDIVISFLETPNFLACFSAIGRREWKLITNELSAKEKSFTSLKGKIFKWFERFSDHIVCNSHNAEKMFIKYYPKYESKISTIYNPVLFDDFHQYREKKKKEDINIVVAASYQYLKNMDGVIEAVNLLNKNYKNRLTINWFGRIEATEGNNQAYKEALKKIDKYSIKNIKLNEATPDIISIMKKSDYVGLFSMVEGLPNAICEGMSLGKPIIMTKVSDYEVLVDNNNGFICDANDPMSIKEALVKAIDTSDNDMKLMGENSLIKARKMFDKELICDQWIKKIELLLYS